MWVRTFPVTILYMAWTQDDLDAIEKAIKTGARSVAYTDRRVEYRDLAEMIQIRDMIRKDLGLVNVTGGRILASYSKGLGGGS